MSNSEERLAKAISLLESIYDPSDLNEKQVIDVYDVQNIHAFLHPQWEPKGGDFYNNLHAPCAVSEGRTSTITRLAGLERETREKAEEAAKAMVTFNRLLAYRDEFDPNYYANWNNESLKKHYIYYDHREGKYFTSYGHRSACPTRVYMSKDVAVELARKLNNREVVL